MKNVMLFLIIGLGKNLSGQTALPSNQVALNLFNRNTTDAFAFTQNQGALAGIEKTNIGVYAGRLFMMQELSDYLLAIGMPTSIGNVGFSYSMFGSKGFRQASMGIAYARRLAQKIDIGVQFNVNSILLDDLGNASVPGIEVGAIFHLSDKFQWGLHAKNPGGKKFGIDQHERFPSVLSMGFGYNMSESFFISTTLIKEQHRILNVRSGFQFNVHKRLQIGIGINSSTGAWWFSSAFRFSKLTVTVSSSMHTSLGPSPALMLNYELTKK